MLKTNFMYLLIVGWATAIHEVVKNQSGKQYGTDRQIDELKRNCSGKKDLTPKQLEVKLYLKIA